MRRFLALIAVPLLACVVLAGCGSSKPAASASSSASSSSSANTSVTATGSFGQLPKVSIPKAQAGSKLTVRTLVQGTGATYTKSDALAANFVLYFWSGTSSSQKASTFGASPTLIPSATLPGLETALVGQKIGSRILAVIPPALGYGPSGNPQLGVPASTTLVFVVDLLKAYANTAGVTAGKQVSNGGGTLPTVSAKAGSAPTLTFPSSPPPSGLVTKTLIKGNGPTVAKGDLVIAQYVGYIWRTKKPFPTGSSSWLAGSPVGFVIGASPAQIIPGWDKGLVGQTVGSRVMLSIPPADGYGSSGSSQAGIKGTDTLAFVVDIVDALK
jgi:FKBP-type peptidyl-prolyl cis-trans isomerase